MAIAKDCTLLPSVGKCMYTNFCLLQQYKLLWYYPTKHTEILAAIQENFRKPHDLYSSLTYTRIYSRPAFQLLATATFLSTHDSAGDLVYTHYQGHKQSSTDMAVQLYWKPTDGLSLKHVLYFSVYDSNFYALKKCIDLTYVSRRLF